MRVGTLTDKKWRGESLEEWETEDKRDREGLGLVFESWTLLPWQQAGTGYLQKGILDHVARSSFWDCPDCTGWLAGPFCGGIVGEVTFSADD